MFLFRRHQDKKNDAQNKDSKKLEHTTMTELSTVDHVTGTPLYEHVIRDDVTGKSPVVYETINDQVNVICLDYEKVECYHCNMNVCFGFTDEHSNY